MQKFNSFPFVEDYIEIIAGVRDILGNSKALFDDTSSPLSLARYDVSMLDSLAQQTSSMHVAYTDKQADLAVSLVLKYERQLAKHHIKIDPIKDSPKFRSPIRFIDRTCRAWVDGDVIKLRFPYQVETVDFVKAQAKNSKGYFHFSKDQRVWIADLTEYNVNLVHAIATSQKFEIDRTLQEHMDKLVDFEKNTYKIELTATKEKLEITNATDSLAEYVNSNLGGFELDNILRLADNSSTLGYTVDGVVGEVITTAYGKRFWDLCTNRELRTENSPSTNGDIVNDIIKYVGETDRFPIFVYGNHGVDNLFMQFIPHFNKDEILNLDESAFDPDKKYKLVYTTKIPKTNIGRIPFMVSGHGMIFGGDRQIWIQNAEKIVYFAKEVYKKNMNDKKGKEVRKLK